MNRFLAAAATALALFSSPFAQANQPSAPAVPSAASLSVYIGEVSAAIRSRLFYPPAARPRGARGVVGVTFTIGASGALASFAITRSSGNKDLDAAARVVVHSAHFPPPPGGWAHITTNFFYVPQGNAVRSLVGGPFLPPDPFRPPQPKWER